MGGVKFGKAGGHTAAAMAQALREGYKFIDLRLTNPLFNGVQGAQILAHKQSVRHVTGDTVYTFEIKGGPLFFDWAEERFGNFCQMVDTTHNRNFLRGLIKKGRKWFEITDKNLEEDIRNGVPAPNSFAAPAAIPAAQPQTIEELTAALNKARAAAGLPPVGFADTLPPQPVAVPTPPQIVNPVVINAAAENTGDLSAVDDITLDELREEGVKPPEPVKKAPAAKSKGKATPKSTFIKMED